MKKNTSITELVPAAQIAGANELSQEFWKQVDAHLSHKDYQRKQLVMPRPLTTPLKKPTI